MQRIEIGAQSDRPMPGPSAFQRADDPSLGDLFRDLESEFAQFFRHQCRGLRFLESDFRIAMDLMPDIDHLRFVGFERGDQRMLVHRHAPRSFRVSHSVLRREPLPSAASAQGSAHGAPR
jgi:hypothetical protein